MAEKRFLINQKPTGGAILVSPTTGIEYDTKFYVIASDFIDIEDGLSFRYKFGYRLDVDKMITWFYDGGKYPIHLGMACGNLKY